ncbi:MAG: NAD-dependent isocitrate dehydrogenase, partial [Methanobacterium sp.]|nr:NAD-dependent isocitrate dehydrogenase [Methanobacterium sp.]
MYNIAVIPGDGIGKEVMEATLHVLGALDIDFDYRFTDAGDEHQKKTGVAPPPETIDTVKA